jgi:hypothetical protein
MSSFATPLPDAAHADTAKPARFDMYGPIHKAVRRFMNHTLERVGALDIGDDADMAATLGQLDALLAGMRNHVKHENDFVHTAIEARQPAGARGTAEDHLEHLESIAALEAEAAALRAAPVEQRDTRAARLYRHLALFVAENLQHMHIEETANNALLWAHYSDAELVEIHDRLVASIPPAEMVEWLRWLAPALRTHELAAMLGDMQAKTPPEAFLGVLDLVRAEVHRVRWATLARMLGVAPAA